jgi:hypothetical protein
MVGRVELAKIRLSTLMVMAALEGRPGPEAKEGT